MFVVMILNTNPQDRGNIVIDNQLYTVYTCQGLCRGVHSKTNVKSVLGKLGK